MELSEMQARVAELEQQIFALPTGSITKKTVSGKVSIISFTFLSTPFTISP